MTFPVVQQVARGNAASNSTALSITMPSTVNAGDLLIILLSNDGNPSITRNNALAQTFAPLFLGANGSATNLSAWWKIADGTEDAASATFTLGASEMSAWQVYRISGAHQTMPPVCSAAVQGGNNTFTGTSTAPNAPAVVAPWGSDDNLWLIAFGADANTADTGSFAHPTNFTTNGIYDEANNSAGCGIGSSYRTNAAASEDAGAWTINASEQWVTLAIAVAPAAAGLAPTPKYGWTAADNAGSGAVTSTKPASTVNGDLLVACITVFDADTNTALTAPSGWTLVTSHYSGALEKSFIYRKVAASEGASYSWSKTGGSAGQFIEVICLVFAGGTFDATTPFDTTSGNGSTTGTTRTGTGITTTRNRAVLLMHTNCGNETSLITSTPSGMGMAGWYVTGGVWYEGRPTAGATSNRTHTQTSNAGWTALMAAINPPATASPSFHAQIIA